eukprot:767497-Pyramimonas_sp.AAC.1
MLRERLSEAVMSVMASRQYLVGFRLHSDMMNVHRSHTVFRRDGFPALASCVPLFGCNSWEVKF